MTFDFCYQVAWTPRARVEVTSIFRLYLGVKYPITSEEKLASGHSGESLQKEKSHGRCR
jgi:hypothetical protein